MFKLLLIVSTLSLGWASDYCSEEFWSNVTVEELLSSGEGSLDEEILNSLVCGGQGRVCSDSAEGGKSCYDEEKNTVLHVAARSSQRPEVIELLILRGADISAINGMGETVIEYSALNENSEIYNLLRRDKGTQFKRRSDEQDGERGWYVGSQLGAGTGGGEDVDANFYSPDVPTNCDGFLNTNPVPLSSPECQVHDIWSDSFDRGSENVMGLQVGYAWENWRLEAELTRQNLAGGMGVPGYTDLHPEATKAAEFLESNQAMRNIRSTGIWANAYYDFNTNSITGAKLRPFVGLGVGWQETAMDYSALWHRNPDPEVLKSLGKIPEAAGTLSLVRSETLKDQNPAAQAMVGLDYSIRKNVSVGIQAQYSKTLGEFSESKEQYDVLRSHPSLTSPGGEPTGYTVEVPEMDSLGVRMNVKVFLGNKKKK